MTNTLKELKKLLHMAGDHKITLRRKLMLYLLCLILAGIGIILLIMAAIGGPFQAERNISQAMDHQLHTSAEKISEEMDVYAGYGLQLSRELGKNIENYLDEKGLSVSDLNDKADELLEVQRLMYSELNTIIRLGRSSGVFAVLDATVNTQLQESDHSRSGVYLRLINVSSNVILSPETILFRGSPEISRENGLELHNRWNMEFNTGELPGYQAIMDGQPESGYYWTSRLNLKNTWENVILLLVPIKASSGEIYGICGIELNAVHFNLEYPAAVSSYGSIVTVLAPLENGALRLDQGMVGNTEGTWIKDTESLTLVEQNEHKNTYSSPTGDYYGAQQVVDIPGYEGQEWSVAVLIPRGSCDRYIMRNRACMLGITVGFTVIMIVLALFLSKRFVRPILQSFQDIRDGNQATTGNNSIAELEELCRWLAAKEKPPEVSELPPNMAELFDNFAKNVKTLTRAEYNIFRYYLNGYEVSQIPAVAFISMSTVKKHNGNIYRKLGISSNDELMIYLDLFRRCDCLEKLQLVDPDEEEKETE